MTYEEKHYSEIYSVLRMLGEEYIKKIPNSLYSYIISNKSNEYNPVFVKDKPLEEQIINQDILDEINCFKYCYWSNESEQDKELQTFMDLLNDYGKWLIWSHTLPKVQSKHIDTLLELLKIPELTKKVWKDTDDNVKDAFFVQIIQEIKDEECILQISNATSIEMIQRHLEVVPIILKVQINTEKRVGYNYYLREMLKEIVKNKDEITKLMNKNRELMIEIFAYLDSDTRNNIVKDIIRECEDGNVAIKIWRNCNSKVQQNNFDEINYMLEKFLDLAKDIIEVTSTDVIIENFDDMIQNEKIALYVWGKTNFKEEFQREKAIYLKQLFERYPDKINLILLGTNGNVQYENRDFIIKQIKDPKNKENLFSNYYHLNSKIKEENLDLFFLILENNPEKICNIWVSSISGEMIENLLTEDFLDRYQTILEKTIYDSKSPWKMWIIQPIEVRNKCKNIFINLIKKYPNEFLRYKQYLAWQDIDLLFEIMEIHKDEAIELWKCIPKKERKNYIDRMIELNKENVQIVEEVWRKSTEEELNEGSLEKIFKILCPNVEDVNKVIENYKKIEKINANIKDKINLKILDPKILKDYSIFIIAQIANYEDIQEKFLQGVKISIRNKIMRDACKNNNDMIMTLNLLLENFEKNKDIIDTINNQDLKSDEINSIMNFLINRDTNKIREFFDIKTSQDVINFNDIKKKKCIEIIERKEYEQEDSYESVRDKREAVLQLFFGISVEDAYFLNERYGNSINNNQSEIGIQEYMNLIKQFLDSEKAKENSINFFTKHKEELLKGSYIWQNMNICKVQAELNKKFSEIYQESIYKIKEEDLLDEKEYYIDKDGNKKEILVYEIKDDFNIFVRSEGAYNTNWEEPENFLDKINTPKIDYHGNCESFIGQDSIAVARTKGVIYGYFK